MKEKVTIHRFQESPNENRDPDIFEEIASVANDDLFRGFIGDRLINPDVVLATEAKGQGLTFYEQLERDAHVSSVLQTRKLAVIGREWEVLPAAETPKDLEVAEFVKQVFANLGGPVKTEHAAAAKSGFDQARLDLLDAVLKGFSVAEILWMVGDDGKLTIDELKGRNPRRFSFDVENRLRVLTLKDAIDGELLPSNKLIILTHEKRYDNPYGTALGQKLWWPVWFKKHGIKFWATFNDKFGMPTAIGKYPTGASKEAKSALLDALRAIQQETAITIPEGMVVELLEAKRSGTVDTYDDFIQFMNGEISKAVLGQTLTTELAGPTGSFAASQTHQEVRLELVKADCDLLCEGINSQLIPPLVQMNFTGFSGFPKMWIRTEEEKDLNALSERDARLSQDVGLPIAQSYFYATYGIPKPEAGDELVTPPSRNPTPAPFAAPNNRGKFSSSSALRFAESNDPEANAVEGTLAMEQLSDATLTTALNIYRGGIQELLNALQRVPTLEAALARMQPGTTQPLPNLGNLIHQLLVTAELTGRATIFEQATSQTNRSLQEILTFQEGDIPDGFDFEPQTPEEALRFFRGLVPVTDAQFQTLNADMRLLAFRIAGVEEEALVRAVHGKINDALEGQGTLGEFLRDAPAIFDTFGVTRRSRHHLETMFRTNTLTALNAGKWEEAHDPDLQEFFPLYRYSAILDDRVRPVHARMHGFTAPIDDPIWETWWPPNGFQCRCTVVPLSEVFVEKNKIRRGRRPPQGINPDPGFQTNPKAALEAWAETA